MGSEMGEGLEAHEARVARLMDRYEALNRAQPIGNTNTASMVFNMGGAGFLIGAALGIGGLALAYGFHKDAETERIRAAANMEIMAAERRADMAAIEAIRSDAEFAKNQAAVAKTMAQQYRMELSDKLSALEAKQ